MPTFRRKAPNVKHKNHELCWLGGGRTEFALYELYDVDTIDLFDLDGFGELEDRGVSALARWCLVPAGTAVLNHPSRHFKTPHGDTSANAHRLFAFSTSRFLKP